MTAENRQYRELRGDLPPAAVALPAAVAEGQGRLVYQKKYELVKPGSEREKVCRVMAYCEPLGMLFVSQPSHTALVPGRGK